VQTVSQNQFYDIFLNISQSEGDGVVEDESKVTLNGVLDGTLYCRSVAMAKPAMP
jgi:hypothetical protein